MWSLSEKRENPNSLWNRWKDKFIISQKSQWKAVFDIWMLVLVGYSCFTTIFYVSFQVDAVGIWDVIDMVVLVFFSLDLIFSKIFFFSNIFRFCNGVLRLRDFSSSERS
jgi:hypothetical protein